MIQNNWLPLAQLCMVQSLPGGEAEAIGQTSGLLKVNLQARHLWYADMAMSIQKRDGMEQITLKGASALQ